MARSSHWAMHMFIAATCLVFLSAGVTIPTVMAQNCSDHGIDEDACMADGNCTVNGTCQPLLTLCVLPTQLLCELDSSCQWDADSGCSVKNSSCLSLNRTDCGASLVCFWMPSCEDSNVTDSTTTTAMPSSTADPVAVGNSGPSDDNDDNGDDGNVGNATPPPDATSAPDNTDRSTGSNAGAIAGGVVGALILLALVVVAVVLLRRKQQRQSDADVQQI
ncbi:hypothetical protein PTSG_06044 [Salpingoeca rosetta]|uniref:Uncharacterized protein n=1 Tax=Salpingoeca rosetta (strain ATCC 50818 / BSB-021) TaxID=946362 RepID=F2UDI4_SALR5|nr:uncharacterized protein PTSG_06044 [Salpingoeca rosetta]EGD74679.1 hypothetical protein PTSG_06044 [Salpingoeca rosetta]|eukprot:XP_004992936.1 hypothetical protein PTSG_06044 [Salpingoeca rosetta]